MKSKLPFIDPELISHLRELYQPLKYDESLAADDFLRKAIFVAGQLSMIDKLESISRQQQKELHENNSRS